MFGTISVFLAVYIKTVCSTLVPFFKNVQEMLNKLNCAKCKNFLSRSNQVGSGMVGRTGNFSLVVMVIQADRLSDGDGSKNLVLR